MLDSPVPVPRALTWATHIDVLPADRELIRRGDCTVVHSPSNPGHWWGNLLLFDEPPAPGELASWEGRFATEFATDAGVGHVTLAWDRTDGALGAAEEFIHSGYELEETVALTARPDELRSHHRANRQVRIRTLDPEPGSDVSAWEQAIGLSAANSAQTDRRAALAFTERRLADLRELFRDGRGAWYVARLGRRVVGGCGIVVTAGRGRYQHVDTDPAYHRRGIASRLVVAAGHHAAERYGAQTLVICADANYHALGLYRSLGFVAAERTAGVCRRPPAERRA